MSVKIGPILTDIYFHVVLEGKGKRLVIWYLFGHVTATVMKCRGVVSFFKVLKR